MKLLNFWIKIAHHANFEDANKSGTVFCQLETVAHFSVVRLAAVVEVLVQLRPLVGPIRPL